MTQQFTYGERVLIKTIAIGAYVVGSIITLPFWIALKSWRQFRARHVGGDVLRCGNCNTVQYGQEHQYCTKCNVSATRVSSR